MYYISSVIGIYFPPNSCSVLFASPPKKNCGIQGIEPDHRRLVILRMAEESESTLGITRCLTIEANE